MLTRNCDTGEASANVLRKVVCFECVSFMVTSWGRTARTHTGFPQCPVTLVGSRETVPGKGLQENLRGVPKGRAGQSGSAVVHTESDINTRTGAVSRTHSCKPTFAQPRMCVCVLYDYLGKHTKHETGVRTFPSRLGMDWDALLPSSSIPGRKK